MSELFRDLTEDDETNIPLPENWIRTIKISSSGKPRRLYKNLNSGLESQEHPIILQALNSARKRTLPLGWSIKEVNFDDGSKDFSYFNQKLGISMWDPPFLRECLIECLLLHGFDPYMFAIDPPISIENNDYHQEGDNFDSNNIDNDFDNVLPHVIHSSYNDDSIVHNAGSQMFTGEYNKDQFFNEFSNNTEFEEQKEQKPLTLDITDNDECSVSVEDTHGMNSSIQRKIGWSAAAAAAVGDDTNVNSSRDWNNLLSEYTDRNSVFTDKISHRINRKAARPPVTTSGVRVLRLDVIEANERNHQLICKLRTVLSLQAGVECSFLYSDDLNREGSYSQRSVVTLASDIVTTLRQRPEYIVMAMATTNKTNGSAVAMVQIAFTALHRLLHPFSTDNSMTTALLLQGINYQLDEMTVVEQIFSTRDSHRILSRALLVSDPVVAIAWDQLNAPLPVVPSTPTETVLSCLLRLYAIRRDVTSYYRTIWSPIVPAIIAVLNSEDCREPHIFANMISVANRLLECTLCSRSMIVFPATATAVCRAMHEIGGPLTMYAYMFNLLILPNVVKVLAGDHDSVENESLYSLDKIQSYVDKYFDHSLWLTADCSQNEEHQVNTAFNPLRSLIWAIWRLYAHAAYMSDMNLTTLTVGQFVGDRLPGVNLSGVPDTKLRNVINRLSRKIKLGREYLLKLPLDAQGSQYLGVDPSLADGSCVPHLTNDHQPDMTKLLDKRLSTLHFKPNEMLNLTVVSKQDVCNLFTDIGVSMELSGQTQGSSLYQAISQYLNLCSYESTTDDAHDELLQLEFLYENAVEDEEFSSQSEISTRYKQLMRGLVLANRYEDMLITLIERVQQRQVSTIFDLAPAASTQSVQSAPEFDTKFKSDDVRLAKLHTVGSSRKAKQSHFGLNEPQPVVAYPLFSNYAPQDHQDPDVKSLAELGQEYFSSYRFGSTAPSVAVGTSIARSKVVAPKLKQNAINVTTANVKAANISTQKSRFTKISVKPDAPFLAATEAAKCHFNKHRTEPETLQSKDKQFMRSMRDHKVIPTEEFRLSFEERKAKRKTQDYQVSMDNGIVNTGNNRNRSGKTTQQRYSSNPNASAQLASSGSVPQPFPEHLRSRVREEGDAAYNWQESIETVSPPRRTTSPKSSRGASMKLSNDSVSKLIRDYQQVFTPIITTPSRNYQISDLQGMTFTSSTMMSSGENPVIERKLSRTSSGSRLVHKRAKSPSLPEPVSGGSRFSAPTQSLLRKMEVDSGIDIHDNVLRTKVGGNSEKLNSRFLQEVHAGILPGLRSYKSSNEMNAPAFIPASKKIYAPSGPRVPRVPDFLVTGQRSRSNSRTSSPNRMNRFDSFSRATRQHGEEHSQSYGTEENDEDYEVDEYYSRQYQGVVRENTMERSAIAVEFSSESSYAPDSIIPTVGESPLGFSVDYDDVSSKFVLNSQQSVQRQTQEALQRQEKQSQQQVYQMRQQQSMVRQNSSVEPPVQKLTMSDEKPRDLPTKRHSNHEDDARIESKQVVRRQEQQPERQLIKQQSVVRQASRYEPNASLAPLSVQKQTLPDEKLRDVSDNDKGVSIESKPIAEFASFGKIVNELAAEGHDSERLVAFEHERKVDGGHVDDHETSSTIPIVNPTSSTNSPMLRRNYSAEELYNAQQSPKQSDRDEVLSSQPLPHLSSQSVLVARAKPPVMQIAMAVENVKPDKHSAVANILSPPAAKTAEVAVSTPVVVPPQLITTVTPLKMHSAYTINFKEIADEERLSHCNVYDTNADREHAMEIRKARLFGKSEDDEDSWGEDDDGQQQRVIKDVLRGSRIRSDTEHVARAGRIPLIKKKSLIPGREDSREFLIKGFQAIKHGRTGAPKQKFISYKPDENVIEWRASKGKLSGFSSFFSSIPAEAVSHISLDSIVEVRRGIQTEVLKKAALVDPFCCFSIVTTERTLDITTTTHLDRDMAIRGLQMLLEFDPKVRFM